MDNIPIISITFRQMEHSVTHAFSDAQIQTDEMFKAACAKAFDPTNIERIIDDEVKAAAAEILKREIKSFFMYNEELRKAVKAGLVEILNRDS